MSPRPGVETSPLQGRHCDWCRRPRPATARHWCSKRCRQTHWRFFQTPIPWDPGDKPLKLAYADPPYPGLCRKYYQHEPTYKGEVNHLELVATLENNYDGWALSTSSEALKWVVARVQSDEVIICPWVKPLTRAVARGPATVTEYVIVSPGRQRLFKPPMVYDSFLGAPARGGDSKLIGRKPIQFVNWLFRLLGASPVDELDDLFPGSGIVGRCWEAYRRSGRTERQTSLLDLSTCEKWSNSGSTKDVA